VANINDAFQPESGINLDDLVGIFAGSADPSIGGETAPIGSLFIRANGELYQKIGALDTAWIIFSQGLSSGVKISVADTTGGYLDQKLNVNATLTKIIDNPGSNENLLLSLAAVGTAGTYKSVTTDAYGRITAGTNPTTLSGFGITDAQPLDATLTALASFNANGILVQTAADTFIGRTITGTTNRTTITNGDGISSNPVIDIAATYVGQTSITTLGTVSTGTWSANTIAANRGGTGQTSYAVGDLLYANTTTTLAKLADVATTNVLLSGGVGVAPAWGKVANAALQNSSITITGGTGLGVSGSPVSLGGTVTLSNTGVTSVTGTANQVNVSASTGAVTFSLPQNINSGATPSFTQVTVSADPSTALEVATKQYVDNLITGLDFKASVRVATTANITLSGTQTVDGIALLVGDRVLVKDQSSSAQNGIYVVSAGTWTRASDANTNAEFNAGLFTFVEEGTTNADNGWVLSSNNPIVLDTTPVFFVQFTGAGQVTAGAGLTKTGNTLDVGTASSSRIVVNADNIDLATVGTPGTYKSVTTDAYGRITAGTNPTTLAGFGIVDAQPLDATLTSLASFNTNGILVQTSADTFTGRVITGTTNRITITNGDGISSNPVIDISSAYVGQASITTLGTIGSGTWNGTVIGAPFGGTGLTSYTTGDLLYSSATNTLARRAIGSTGQVLTVSGGVPTWVTPAIAGTVTSVSVTTANGVSGSVATSTTTPAITLTLGAITPTSVASVGTITGSNLSGTNTGDQTITLTGDVTGAGTGSFGTTLATVNANVGTFAVQTVNAKGLVTSATTLTGDATSSGDVLTLATVNASPQTDQFRKITVNGKGLVTASSAVTTADITALIDATYVNTTGDTMSGSLTATTFIPTSSSAPTNGLYLSATDTLGFSTNSVNRATISSTGITVTGKLLATNPNADSATLLSGASGSYTSLSIGRTTQEGYFGIAAAADNFLIGSVAGDLNILNVNNILFGTGTTQRFRINTNGNVAVGASTLVSKFQVNSNGTGTNVSSGPAGTIVHASQNDATPALFLGDGYGGTGYTAYAGRRASGTAAAKTATAQDNGLVRLEGYGYGSTGYVGATKGFIGVNAGQQWTDTANGTYIAFQTTANGSTSLNERVRIDGDGNLLIQVAGTGFRVKEGTNAKQGTSALTAGSVVVSNTSVTANSRIFLTSQADGGTPGFLRVSTRTAGTSFTITSSSGTDTSTVAWEIFEPA
jgi:hypothetical protein